MIDDNVRAQLWIVIDTLLYVRTVPQISEHFTQTLCVVAVVELYCSAFNSHTVVDFSILMAVVDPVYDPKQFVPS